MANTIPEQNKALVLRAFDTLFNKRDYEAAALQLGQDLSSCRSYEGCSPGIGLRGWGCEAPTSRRETPDERS
jgi:hypothetical protein